MNNINNTNLRRVVNFPRKSSQSAFPPYSFEKPYNRMEQVTLIKAEKYLDNRMKDLFSKAERNEMCDIEFHFKDENITISAHRIILGNASAVFAAMTFGPMKETSAVTVDFLTSISFKKMLRFIYTGEVGVSENTVVGVLHAAHKYLLPELEDLCVDYISQNINIGNVLNYLNTIPEGLVTAELMTKLWKTVGDHPLPVIQSKYFINLEKTVLEKLLERKYFTNLNDSQLFQRILEWCTHNCLEENIDPTPENKRTTMPIKYLENITAMPLDQFVLCASSEPGFFTAIEFQHICENIAKKTDVETFLATLNSITDNKEPAVQCSQCKNKSKTNENAEKSNEEPKLNQIIEGFFQNIHNQTQPGDCIANDIDKKSKIGN